MFLFRPFSRSDRKVVGKKKKTRSHFFFRIAFIIVTSNSEAERERETNLTEHDLAVISCI